MRVGSKYRAGIQVHVFVFKAFRSVHVHFISISGYSSLTPPIFDLDFSPWISIKMCVIFAKKADLAYLSSQAFT